jgi:hypothetical protein
MAGQMRQATSLCAISIAKSRILMRRKVVKPGAERCLKRGLSRMRGNSQVRFLGEKKAVMPFSYPTE